MAAVPYLGPDRVRTIGRETNLFLIRLTTGETSGRGHRRLRHLGTLNVLGASGTPAHGETDVTVLLDRALPDVLGAKRDCLAGRRTLVVGAGHSAANTLLSLHNFAEQERRIRATWAIRATSPAAPTAARQPMHSRHAAPSASGYASTSKRARSNRSPGFLSTP
ncbi:hypothetical protein ACI2K4_29240 [Micromonospora sp. NPDC050397]|uniref:hypothetical protein n=1 Tax=Micromonospora sp. NPDC050397 TaxID=3364279 RepID=UPI00384BD4FF